MAVRWGHDDYEPTRSPSARSGVEAMSAGYLKKCSSNGKPKKRHATQEAAESQRWGLIRSGRWRAATSNTYWCNQCGGYHAGELGRANRGKGRTVAAKNRPRHLATQ